MQANKEVLAALASYIQAEIDGHDFYILAAQRTSDPRGKAMFESLARDEVGHRQKLEAQYASILEKGCWLSAEECEAAIAIRKAGKRSPFADYKSKVKTWIKKGAGDLDALKVGIEKEKESYSAYSEAAKKATHLEGAAMFRELAEEESGHLRLLENTYSYLADTGSWFLTLEKGPVEP